MNEGSKPEDTLTLVATKVEDPAFTQEKALQDVMDLVKEDWSIAVRQQVGEEQRERAAILMHNFSEGAADVVKAVASRGRLPSNYRVPHMRIGDNQGIDASYAYAVSMEDGQPAKVVRSEIVVDATGLGSLAQDDPSAVYEIYRINSDGSKVITKVGTPSEMAYTNGAEETAHSLFLYLDVAKDRFRPNESRGNDDVDLAEYDAQPMEYHGRGWQVRAILDAKKEGRITAEEAEMLAKPFIDRIRAAAKYRKENKSAEQKS